MAKAQMSFTSAGVRYENTAIMSTKSSKLSVPLRV
jgi:hypothetical protein